MEAATTAIQGFWNVGNPPPMYMNCKLILLTHGGVIVIGKWGDDIKAWSPCPKYKDYLLSNNNTFVIEEPRIKEIRTFVALLKHTKRRNTWHAMKAEWTS